MDVRANLISVAAEFAALGLEVIFTGGSSISEYLDAELPESVRPTIDVDVVVNIATRRQFYEFMARLDEAMWGHPQMEGDAPIGRRRTPGGILVDVIPVSDVALGFTNRWYAEGLNRTWTRDGTVRLFPVDVLIASKLEAFASRGRGDWFGSHDIEDVVTVIEGRSTISPTCPRLQRRSEKHSQAG